MPTVQLLNGIVESAANQALNWASNTELALAPLVGKSCIIHIQEFKHVMCFHFSSHKIDVLADEAGEYASMPSDLNDEQCWVSISLFALDKLKQNNQMTRLIKTGQLDFAGDLSILQAVSGLFTKIDLDFEEVLSFYIGDPLAYQFNTAGKNILAHANSQISLLTNTLSDLALDEKPVGVRKIMLINFSDEVNQLHADTERFEAKLAILEAQVIENTSRLDKGRDK